jgi:hypothetical protein
MDDSGPSRPAEAGRDVKPRSAIGRTRRTTGADESPPEENSPPVTGDQPPPEDGISPGDDLPRPPDSAPIRPDLGPPAPGPRPASQPGSGLGLVISVTVAAIIFVLAIYATGSPTPNPLPLAQTTNTLFWGVAAIAVAAAGIGAEYADRTASRAKEQLAPSAVRTAWIVPAIATAAAIVLVATFHNTTMIVVGPLIAFLGNAGALLSRDLLDDADDAAQRTATTVHTLVIHVVAFLALSAIYLNKLPTTLLAGLSAVIGALLVLEIIDRAPIAIERKATLSLLAGGALAAAATPLTWWLTHGWTGGAVLFVVFYFVAGVLQVGVTRGGFRPRDAIEYAAVPLAALVVLAITA